MRIKDLVAQHGEQFISLEFFPPKEKDKWDDFFAVVDKLRATIPLFVSVTYGAGGSTQDNTLEIVTRLKRDYDLEPMAHLTCVGASEESISSFLTQLKEVGVDNVLALRGDPPQGQDEFVPDSEQFQYAEDLVKYINGAFPDFGVGVACYPEKHPQAPSLEEDLGHLKDKLDQGGDFAVTQLFFENDAYFAFVDKARALGITKPIVPGVLPILSLGSIKRILSMCDTSLPASFMEALERAFERGGDIAVRELGIQYARKQVRDLLDRGAPGVHLYTLNKAEACLEIIEDLDICQKLGSCS